MSRLRLRPMAGAFVVVLALAMLAGVAWYLADTQAEARSRILSDFDARGRLAAQVSGDVLGASDAKTRSWATSTLAGPVKGLPAVLDANRAGVDALMILRGDGTLLAASPRSVGAVAATLRDSPGFRLAVSTGRLAYGDIQTGDLSAGGSPEVVFGFLPYQASDGTRVFAVPQSAADVSVIAHSTINVAGARSYVIDGTGSVVASSERLTVGRPIPDRALGAAIEHSTWGVVAGDNYLSAPIAGTAWRVVLVESHATLMAPVAKPARVTWMIFSGFAVVVMLILVIGAAALVGSARVAHARLHDALTGLPNRALFLVQAEQAIAQKRAVAVLFLDLDGFKPVNDTYGHAAGDALLAEVGRRLVAATRPADYVSRFGGDEFLVLCRGPAAERDTHATADRIRASLTEPYDIGGRTITVGVSIGLAAYDGETVDPEVLIHRADLALYQAKRNGRGSVEEYSDAMAAAQPATP